MVTYQSNRIFSQNLDSTSLFCITFVKLVYKTKKMFIRVSMYLSPWQSKRSAAGRGDCKEFCAWFGPSTQTKGGWPSLWIISGVKDVHSYLTCKDHFCTGNIEGQVIWLGYFCNILWLGIFYVFYRIIMTYIKNVIFYIKAIHINWVMHERYIVTISTMV